MVASRRSVVVAALWVLSPARTFAADTAGGRVAILPTVIKEADVLGELNAEALHQVAFRTLSFSLDLEPVPHAEVHAIAGSLSYCGADVRCLSTRLREARIPFALEIIVNQSLDPPIVAAQLIDTTAETAVAHEVEPIDRDVDRARSAIGGLTTRLLDRAVHPTGGKLHVIVEPADAQVSIEPPATRVSIDGRKFTVPSGTYHVRVHRPGFVEKAQRAIVRRGEETSLRVQLDEELPMIPLWGWVAIGAGAITAVTVVVLVASSSPDRVHLCQGDLSVCR